MRTQAFPKIAIPAVAIIAAFAVCLPAPAQENHTHSGGLSTTVHGVPPSVTSFGFGGRPGFHGMPASVTSPGFTGTPFRFNHGIHQPPLVSQHRHRNRSFPDPFYGNGFAVPYAYPVYVDEAGVDDSMEEEAYRGGPTIFDRRGPGRQEYIEPDWRYGDEPDADEAGRPAAPLNTAAQAEVANQPPTVLIFKDGRQVEVLNYAIVGPTLYDLSKGTTRKIALAELDLPATVKQNDDRGVDFQLPAGAKPN